MARKRLAVGLAVLSLSVGLAARADEQESETVEVVVTATRVETPTEEIASSVTLITAEDLAKAQVRMVVEALKGAPALDFAQTGGPGAAASVFIRGAKSEHTLVLIDGIEANNPILLGRSFEFANLTTDNIERIEILRGPQSTLYGSDAIGGVINIITRKGRGKPRFWLLTEGGSFDTLREAAGLSGGNDWINYAVQASHSST